MTPRIKSTDPRPGGQNGAGTRIAGVLEDLGHLRRTPDPDDRRASVVAATTSGQRVVQAGRDSRVTALRARVEALSQEDRDVLRRAVPVLEALGAQPAPDGP